MILFEAQFYSMKFDRIYFYTNKCLLVPLLLLSTATHIGTLLVVCITSERHLCCLYLLPVIRYFLLNEFVCKKNVCWKRLKDTKRFIGLKALA